MTITRILVGDVRERVRDLPDESVHCVVTSPPYFGLRDYGCDGQIGLEATPDAYVAEMVSLFRSVKKVLRSDGTFWLNLGDSYAGGGYANHKINGPEWFAAASLDKRKDRQQRLKKACEAVGIKPKDRMMIPARVALALQADGWWLRDEIIWHKPNPMPVSVTDRTTPAHEMLYMFSKSARYHYDMEQILEDAVTAVPHKHWKDKSYDQTMLGSQQSNGVKGRPTGVAGYAAPGKRQPRSVWSIATRPFKGAHFATFPPDLIRPCILAGCPVGGTVLDPFFGAGTTGLVAQQLGRNCIGFELNPEYAAIARERLGLPTSPDPLARLLVWNAAVASYRSVA